jgi:hypothetical protein
MTIARLAMRTSGRYAASLVPLATIALGPWLWLALEAGVPRDPHSVQIDLVVGWLLAATAWVPQVALVACAGPLVRALRTSQSIAWRPALASGLSRLARAIPPTLIVVLAVALGTLALVVPGGVLLVLLATANASESSEPTPARLLASALTARRHMRRAIAVVATVVALDLVLALVLQLVFVRHLAGSATELARAQTFLRALALGLVVVSPLCACLLAASRSINDDAERA